MNLTWLSIRMAAGVVLIYLAAACNTPTRRVFSSSGRSYDVISIERASGRQPGSTTSNEAVVINYFTSEGDAESRSAEAQDVVEFAIPTAERFNDSTIYVYQTIPVIGRWTGIVRGYVLTFRLREGRWVRVSTSE